MANIENMGTNVGTQVINTGTSWITEYVYEAFADMVNKPMNSYPLGTDNIPEGQMIYCLEDQKYYIYREQTAHGNKATGTNRWLKLDSYIQNNNIYILDEPLDNLETSLKQSGLHNTIATGGLVYAKCNNTLYFNTYIKNLNYGETQPSYLEDSTGYFYPLPTDLDLINIQNQLTNINDYIYSDDPNSINYKLSDNESKIANLSEVVDSMNVVYTNWDTKLTNVDTKLTNMDTVLATFVNDVESLQDRTEVLDTRLTTIEDMYLNSDILGSALGTSEDPLIGLGTIIKWLGTSVSSLISDPAIFIELGTDITDSPEPLSGFETIVNWLGTSVKTNKTSIINLKDELEDEITDTRGNLTKNLSDLKNELEEDISAVRKDLSDGLYNLKDELGSDISVIRNDLTTLTGNVSDLRIELEGDISVIREDLTDGLSGVRSKLSSDISAVRKELSDGLSNLKDELGSDVSAVRKDLTDDLTELEYELGSDISVIRNDLTTLTGDVSDLKIELKSDISVVRKDLTDGLSNLRSELEGDISVVRKDLTDGLSDLKGELEGDISVVRKDLTDGLSDLKSELESDISVVHKDLTDNYVKTTELPNSLTTILPGILPDIMPDYSSNSKEFTNLKNAVTTNTNAIAEVSDRVDGLDKTVSDNHKNTQSLIAATQGMIVSSISGLQHNVEVLTKSNNDLTDNCKELNKVTQDHTNKLDGWKETVGGSTIQHKGLIEDLSDFKQHVKDNYTTPADVSSLLNYYSPDVAHQNKWVGREEYPNLVGKTGKEIALERHSYNSIFDQIVFADYEPTVSEPSANVALKEVWANGMSIDWYDKEKRIILVKDGSAGPDGGDFYPTNVVDAMISYPKNITLDPHFTNGPILKSDTKQSSIGFCKIQNEKGEWDYYKKDNNVYHVPAVLQAGEYRYYMATYFTKGSPAINNNGLTVKEWNENTPVESKDYITIIASKPSYYTTPKGEVENPLQYWSDNITNTMELYPSCQCPQQFSTPRPLKNMYIWNDVAGDFARVPNVNNIPVYMIETIEDNGYHKYRYDSDTYGHRGSIKVKIEF